MKTAFFAMQYYSRLIVGKEYAPKIERFLRAYGLNENRTGDISIFTNCGTLEGIMLNSETGNSATVMLKGNSSMSVYLVIEKLIQRIPGIKQNYRIVEQEAGRHLKKGKGNTRRLSPADTSRMPSVCPAFLLRNEYADLEDFRKVGGLKKER